MSRTDKDTPHRIRQTQPGHGPCWPRCYGPPPGWFIAARWTRPDRGRVRNQLTQATQEHRATGDVDVVPDTRQHRHGANRDWW